MILFLPLFVTGLAQSLEGPRPRGRCFLPFTLSGKRCQRWDVTSPHRPKYYPFPRNHNYCANPDNDPAGNWCYTMDPNKRFEYCGSCYKPTIQPSKDCSSLSTTQHGFTCQRWDTNFPHKPFFRPEPANHNFCRSPDNNSRPWCYTTSRRKTWDYCDCETTTTTTAVTTRPTTAPNGRCHPYLNFWSGDEQRPSILLPSGTGFIPRTTSPPIRAEDYTSTKFLSWQTYLRGPKDCDGTLISLKTVITAMSCVWRTTSWQWKVSAGHKRRNMMYARRELGWQIRQVHRIIQHPSYNPYTMENDIAILIMDSPFYYTDWVRPVCLPQTSYIEPGSNLIHSGWGEAEQQSSYGSFVGNSWKGENLMLEVVTVNENGTCQYYFDDRLTDSMICAGERPAPRGARPDQVCQGHSGGPLVGMITRSEIILTDTFYGQGHGYYGDLEFTLLGITSWGYGCAKFGDTIVYTNVGDYVYWINQYL